MTSFPDSLLHFLSIIFHINLNYRPAKIDEGDKWGRLIPSSGWDWSNAILVDLKCHSDVNIGLQYAECAAVHSRYQRRVNWDKYGLLDVVGITVVRSSEGSEYQLQAYY
jgi:hypothetical protein